MRPELTNSGYTFYYSTFTGKNRTELLYHWYPENFEKMIRIGTVRGTKSERKTMVKGQNGTNLFLSINTSGNMDGLSIICNRKAGQRVSI